MHASRNVFFLILLFERTESKKVKESEKKRNTYTMNDGDKHDDYDVEEEVKPK